MSQSRASEAIIQKKLATGADFTTNQATTNTIEDVNKAGKKKNSIFIQSVCDIGTTVFFYLLIVKNNIDNKKKDKRIRIKRKRKRVVKKLSHINCTNINFRKKNCKRQRYEFKLCAKWQQIKLKLVYFLLWI